MKKGGGREIRHNEIEGWREKEGENDLERKKHTMEKGVVGRRKGWEEKKNPSLKKNMSF